MHGFTIQFEGSALLRLDILCMIPLGGIAMASVFKRDNTW